MTHSDQPDQPEPDQPDEGAEPPRDGTGATSDRAAAPAVEHRSIATIRGELADVERHLREVPPHHDGGSGALVGRADRLRRELAAALAAHVDR